MSFNCSIVDLLSAECKIVLDAMSYVMIVLVISTAVIVIEKSSAEC